LSSGALTISSNPLMVVFGVASPATPFFSPTVARAVTVTVDAATVAAADLPGFPAAVAQREKRRRRVQKAAGRRA